MSEVVYKDYIPANARIVVNYRAKEKVKFSYPIEWTYWKAVRKRALPVVIQFICMIIIKVLLYVGIFVVPYFLINLYLNPVVRYVEAHYSTLDLSLILRFALPIFFVEVFIILIIPVIITIYLALDKDRLGCWIPRLGYYSALMVGRLKEKTFEVGDVLENKVIIPNFSNVFLEYECNGGFDKYLERIEIIEYPFSYKIRKFFFPYLRKFKKEKNDYEFRAVFYFSKKPLKGDMNVIFS